VSDSAELAEASVEPREGAKGWESRNVPLGNGKRLKMREGGEGMEEGYTGGLRGGAQGEVDWEVMVRI